ncbi:class I SAM-dependent methyltransferase [Dictyobacter aurantiacus]|uniref:Methyltransferase domain-containing protein n=1 Tax=Dictyobacter aurantiacus TaxID=1936993 RepID=A0A401ZT05_9CHLR|nr:methyltransferase domain-containing protein [Dictyobacter aurantiacus]GCE09914.1 hypothetical protein KDAU_72430 [Dictyobacter aurantiacus]
MTLLDAAFAHPQGLAGRLGAMIMAYMTRQRNLWTISLLDLRPNDHILEVGFGPGALIQEMALRVPEGFVAGVDASSLMVRQATRRNKKAIQSKQVVLKEGSALTLPFEDNWFDVALSANSIQIWPDQLTGVKEMYRVLKRGGRVALILQPVWAKADQEVKDIGAGLLSTLKQAGFQQTRLEFKSMKPVSTVCALGIKECA